MVAENSEEEKNLLYKVFTFEWDYWATNYLQHKGEKMEINLILRMPVCRSSPKQDATKIVWWQMKVNGKLMTFGWFVTKVCIKYAKHGSLNLCKALEQISLFSHFSLIFTSHFNRDSHNKCCLIVQPPYLELESQFCSFWCIYAPSPCTFISP